MHHREAGNSSLIALIFIAIGSSGIVANQFSKSTMYSAKVAQESLMTHAEQLNFNALTLLASTKGSSTYSSQIAANSGNFTFSTHPKLESIDGSLVLRHSDSGLSINGMAAVMSNLSSTAAANGPVTRLSFIDQYQIAGVSYWEVEAQTPIGSNGGSTMVKRNKARFPVVAMASPAPVASAAPVVPVVTAANPAPPTTVTPVVVSTGRRTPAMPTSSAPTSSSSPCGGALSPGNSNANSQTGNATANAGAVGNNTATGATTGNLGGRGSSSGSCARASSN